jgi:hypothetical protein
MMPIGLSLGTADSIGVTAGAPIGFGAVNFGSGSSTGGSAPNQRVDNGGATSIPVNPMAITSLIPGVGNADSPWTDILPGLMNTGLGLNGNQVQDPMAALLTRASAPGNSVAPAGAGASESGLPVVGIAGLAIAAVGAFLIMRK